MGSKLYSLVVVILASVLVTGPVPVFSAGQQFEFLLNQQRYASGSLAGGKVYFYETGTTTLKTVYLNVAATDNAANPYTLDANGTAHLYGNGTYRVVIKTAAGVTIYDRDNLKIENVWTSLTDSSYTETIRPKSVIGNNTGNISGFDNGTFTARVTMADLTVTGTSTFTDNTINGADLIDNTVTSAKILDNTITSGKILDNTIAIGKLGGPGTRDDTTFLRGDGTWAAIIPQITTYRNLLITTPADNQNVTITADKVVVVDSDNADAFRTLSSVSLTVALDATNGANGLDNSYPAANTGYFLYVIDNGTTTAGLASTSATAPVMPSGYTYKALVGWCTTDNTATPFNIEEFTQVDDVYAWSTAQLVYTGTLSTTTLAIDLTASGILGYQSVPTIAKEAIIRVRSTSGVYLINNVTFSNAIGDDTPLVWSMTYLAGGTVGHGHVLVPLVEAQTLYHQHTSTQATKTYITGFTLKR